MKNSDKAENYSHGGQISQKTENSNPNDSENLDNELGSESKDITEKDIKKNLIDNDPSKGFETDIDKSQSNEDENDTFEMTGSDKDNPVNKEFEIGQLGNEELKDDELKRDETDSDAVHFNKPSQRKF